MRVRLVFRTGPNRTPSAEVFSSAFLPDHSSTWPLLGSAAVHLVGLWLLPVMAQLMGMLSPPADPLPQYHVEMIHLRVPQTLYYAAPSDRRKPSPAGKSAKKQDSPGRTGPASTQAADNPPQPSAGTRGVRIPKNLELPPMPKSVADAPLILQPPSAIEAPPLATVVPPLAFWARQDINIPKPPPRPFIAPGRVEAPAPAPQLEAPPVLAVPNREVKAGEINMSAAITLPSPALPVENSATVPVRIRDAAPDPKPGGIERQEGEAANVIAISPTRVPPGQVVSIPKGLQNVPAQGDGGDSDPGSHSATPAPARTTSAEVSKTGNRPAGNSTGTAAPNSAKSAAADASAKALATAARGSATATAASGTAAANGRSQSNGRAESAGNTAHPPASANSNPSSSGTAPSTTSSASAAAGHTPNAANPADPTHAPSSPNAATSTTPAAGTDAVTRIVHPVNGNFDVVIMQSATRGDLTDVTAVLTGNPVYTVYLPVGDTREWVMEYCVPAAENAKNNPYEVYVGDATPITAPYPISTVIPNSVFGQAHSQNIVFHGFLTVNGSFRNIEGHDQSALSHQISLLLNQWKFRPAMKDKVPAEIEILLVVPARI